MTETPPPALPAVLMARADATPVAITRGELLELMHASAAEGARQALAGLGLHDKDAAEDLREVRNLLDAWRSAKRGAWQAMGKFLTVAFLAGLAAAFGGDAIIRRMAGQ